jgi:hypothetical protein
MIFLGSIVAGHIALQHAGQTMFLFIPVLARDCDADSSVLNLLPGVVN